MKVLVVAAHPDDEVLGCGATAARLAQEGHEVYFAILGEGITSRYPKREEASRYELEALQECSRRAVRTVGAKEVFFYGLPDNRFDSVPLLDVIHIVEQLLEKVRPHVIYTHHQGDLNYDHVILHRAVLTATRPTPEQTVERIYAFEVASSTEWAFQRYEASFRPNVFVEVRDTLDKKIQALSCYETEIRPFPHPRSSEALRASALRWGSVAGCGAAEAFELIRDLCRVS